MREGDRIVPAFPNARYLFARAEWEHWSSRPMAAIYASTIDVAVRPIVDAGLADFVEPDHKLCDSVRLVPTAGHTPGHVSVEIASQGERAFITGDMTHHPVQWAEPDWKMPADVDSGGRRGHAAADRERARRRARARDRHPLRPAVRGPPRARRARRLVPRARIAEKEDFDGQEEAKREEEQPREEARAEEEGRREEAGGRAEPRRARAQDRAHDPEAGLRRRRSQRALHRGLHLAGGVRADVARGLAGLEDKLKRWEQMQSGTTWKATNVWVGRRRSASSGTPP